MIDRRDHPVAVWSGDLLWPCTLPAAPIIDARQVTCLGVWAHAWLRERPEIIVIADERLRERLCAVGIRCHTSLDEVGHSHGVSASERALLWDEP